MSVAPRSPSFGAIAAADLASDERLAELFVEAVARGFWGNGNLAALEFWCLAEKALQDDTLGTPGRLFHALVKAGDLSRVTDAQEARALARMPGGAREALALRASGAAAPPAPAPEVDAEALFGPSPVGFHHSVMMMCFLPQKRLPPGERAYTTRHGRAALSVEAGSPANPDNPGQTGRPPARRAPLPPPPRARRAQRRGGLAREPRQRRRDPPLRGALRLARAHGRALRQRLRGAQPRPRGGPREEPSRVPRPPGALVRRAPRPGRRRAGRGGRRREHRARPVGGRPGGDERGAHREPGDLLASARRGRAARVGGLDAPLPRLLRPPRPAPRAARPARLPAGREVPVPAESLRAVFAPDIAAPRLFRHRLAADLGAVAAVYRDFRVRLEGDRLVLERSRPPVDRDGIAELVPAPRRRGRGEGAARPWGTSPPAGAWEVSGSPVDNSPGSECEVLRPVDNRAPR